MAQSPKPTNGAPAAAAGAKRKPARKPGPRTFWLLFKPGTDPQLVSQLRDSIDTLTGNGRKMLDAMESGSPPPFFKFTVSVTPRADGSGEDAVEGKVDAG